VFEHGLRGGTSRYGLRPIDVSRATSYGVGALLGPVQFALLGLGRVGAAIRSRPLRPLRSSTHPLSRDHDLRDLEPRCAFAWQRLSAFWMLTLRAPSFHVGAGRAFAENDPTSDVLCRLVAPARWLQTNCPLLLGMLLSSLPSHVDRETRIVPPSPRFEEPSSRAGWPVTRRWRNDSERLPSYQLPCELPLIRMAFHPCKPDTLRRRTESRIMPPL